VWLTPSRQFVGVLLLSTYGGPCSVNGQQHTDCIDLLNVEGRKERCWFEVDPSQMVSCPVVGAKVLYTKSPVDDHFLKIVRFDLYDSSVRGHSWRKLHEVYQAYSRLSIAEFDSAAKAAPLKRAPGLPEALHPACALYGEFQVFFPHHCPLNLPLHLSLSCLALLSVAIRTDGRF
jgi:hypothetical protein